MKRHIGIFILVLIGLLAFSTPVYAISNPNSITIEDIAVFRNVRYSGDQLFFCAYNITYSVEPSESPGEAFQMWILDTDGTFTGYATSLNYYGYNIISIYLTEAQSLTWGNEYKIRILGNPGIFSSLVEGVNMRTRTLGSSNFKEGSELGSYLILQAGLLEPTLGDLLTEDKSLTLLGARYFTEAIPGLYNMAPEIFSVTAYYPTFPEGNYTSVRSDEWSEHRGPRVTEAASSIANWLGTSSDWITLGWGGLFLVLLGALAYVPTKNPAVPLIVMLLALPVISWLGWMTLVSWVLVFAILGILFGVIFILGRL